MAKDKKRVLITGASGLLGANVALTASKKKDLEVYATYKSHPVRINKCRTFYLDITHKKEVEQSVLKINPDFVIHTAALANVDHCQQYKKEAWILNVSGTENLVDAVEKISSRLVYISTDSVFDGRRGCYTEKDRPNPLNWYAKTKLAGEKIVAGRNGNHTIIRTNIYGWNITGKFSLAEWVIDGLKNRKTLTMFKDILFNPILVTNLAEALLDICQKNLSGTFHIAGSEKCSKLIFAEKIAKIFKLNRDYIRPVNISHINLNAPRPRDSSLNITRIQKTLDTKLLNVEEGLTWMKKLQENGYLRELKGGHCEKSKDRK